MSPRVPRCVQKQLLQCIRKLTELPRGSAVALTTAAQ